jgi:N,N'-diacetylchitobiose transport system substrate-binding protein
MIRMRQSRRTIRSVAVATGIVVAGAVGLAGCSSPSAESTSSAASGKGKTLDVWFMQAGPYLTTSLPAINKEFEKKTGAQVKVEVQQWQNINTKLTTALASDNPPDVLEIGNTDIPLFAANGALLDITSSKSDLEQGQTWLSGLQNPATIDHKLYAVPLHAGTRAVVYNKDVWAAAGITAPPKNYDELTADLDKVKAANPSPDYSPLYFAGGNWYVGLQFVYDTGGELAKQGKDGTWSATISSTAAQKGLAHFKQFQNAYSTVASQTASASVPDPNTLIETGKASAIFAANPTSIPTIEAAAPQLKGKLGSFPMPSIEKPGTNMPAWVGGSDVAISAKTKNADLAKQYLKLIASPATQKKYIAGIDGDIPISNALIDAALPNVGDAQKAFFEAAKKSVVVPVAPGWATVETDNSVADLFTQVATGTKSPSQAASGFDSHLGSALNAGQ